MCSVSSLDCKLLTTWTVRTVKTETVRTIFVLCVQLVFVKLEMFSSFCDLPTNALLTVAVNGKLVYCIETINAMHDVQASVGWKGYRYKFHSKYSHNL